MSMKAPPTLLQLAGQNLQRKKAWSPLLWRHCPWSSSLCSWRPLQIIIVEDMVQAWNFPRPLGALMETQDL
jgi:hypothetical protein